MFGSLAFNPNSLKYRTGFTFNAACFVPTFLVYCSHIQLRYVQQVIPCTCLILLLRPVHVPVWECVSNHLHQSDWSSLNQQFLETISLKYMLSSTSSICIHQYLGTAPRFYESHALQHAWHREQSDHLPPLHQHSSGISVECPFSAFWYLCFSCYMASI